MKGFVLAGVVGYLESEYGEKVAEAQKVMLADGPLSEVYLSMDNYPDNSLDDLITSVAKILSIQKCTLAKVIGVYLFSELMVTNPAWVEQSSSAYELLKSHNTPFNQLTVMNMPGFISPSFDCTEINCDVLEVIYRSEFLPSDIAEGLIVGISSYYDEHLSIEKINVEPQVDFNRKFILRRKHA